MYEHYTRPSVDDIFAGKTSKYALAIAVAKRAREITDDLFAEKEKGGKGSDWWQSRNLKIISMQS